MSRQLVAVVTGASRGAGRGIAIALGSHGCTVYVTGRSQKAGDSALPGTIYETADAVTSAGGRGIAVRVDHANDQQVKDLFAQIGREQNGVDILVNNACALSDALTEPGKFWEKPLEIADMITVGLRSSFVSSYYAAPLMVDRERALMAFTSASGAVHYSLSPAYGAHKAGMDKMAFDMAVEFRGSNVTSLSIWMGALLTGRLQRLIASDPGKYAYLEESLETPEFTGHVIWALFCDPDLAALSGQAVIGAEMGSKYAIVDAQGRQPPSCRDMYGVAPFVQFPKIIR
jgi:NAD(P)-dependent dehydrogenase (short-subunit alcohol dehydrogenase family)